MSTGDLSVAELRAATAKLLDAIEERFGPHLHLEDDFYWNVPFGKATGLRSKPELDMGSVVDDATSIREFLSLEDEEVVSIWHESDHIAGVLRAIARLDLPPARS